MEGIGAISKAEGKKAMVRSGNYQDIFTRPLSQEHDDNITGDADADEIDADLDPEEYVMHVLPVVEKVSVTVLHIHSL